VTAGRRRIGPAEEGGKLVAEDGVTVGVHAKKRRSITENEVILLCGKRKGKNRAGSGVHEERGVRGAYVRGHFTAPWNRMLEYPFIHCYKVFHKGGH